MNELKELIAVFNTYVAKKPEIFDVSTSKGKISKLYEAVKNGQYQTEAEAIIGLYGTDKKEFAFRKVKKRLRKQLLNSILLAESQKLSESDMILHSYRMLSMFTQLLTFGAFSACTTIGKRLLRTAQEIEATELCLMVGQRMRKLAERKGERHTFDYYNKIVNDYQQLHFAELKAAEYEQSITIHFSKTRSAKTELAELAKKYATELEGYTKKLYSPKLYLHAYNVYVLRYEISGEFEKMQKTCKEAVRSFEERGARKPFLIFFFLFKSLSYYVRAKQFEEGKDTVNRAISKLDSTDGRNYFITIEQYILLAFHCKKYRIAYEQYHAVVNKRNFGLMIAAHKEFWKIYEAYLEFLIVMNRLDTEGMQRKSRFRLGKFLNDVPVYSKDKMGFNVSILIVQILFLLQKQKYGVLIDRVDGLRVYAYRYLKKSETMRSYYFVRMLLEIPEAAFHKEGVIRRAEKYYKRLQQTPSLKSKDAGSIEVVPYEDLWEMALETLDSKLYITRSRKKKKGQA